MKKFFENNKSIITGISAIFTSIGVVGALTFPVYEHFIKERAADVEVSQFRHFSEGGTQEVLFYNSGDAPCLEFIISYPSTAQPAYVIYNYSKASLSEVTLDENSGKLAVPARISSKVEFCGQESCLHKVGYLAQDSLYAMNFKGKMTGKVTASCVGFESSIQLER